MLSQLLLSKMYTLGVGVSKNYSKVFAWTKKAAEQGFVEAQYELGSMYSEGVVVTKNYLRRQFIGIKKQQNKD